MTHPTILKRPFSSIWIFRIFTTMILVGVIIVVIQRVEKPLCDKCNVILVSLDTLSALHLPCYGYGRNTAPNLCSFAKKNLLFYNTYSQAPITLDSHFSIFTSLYPHTHQMIKILEDPLDRKYLTLPQIFQSNDYQTLYHGILNQDHLPLNRGIERGFNYLEGDSTIDTWDKAYARILDFADNKKPFFAFLHTYAVHAPYLTGHLNHPFIQGKEDPNIALTNYEFNSYTFEFLKYAAKLIQNKNNLLINSHSKEKDYILASQVLNQTNFADALVLYNQITDATKARCRVQWYWDKINKNDPNQVDYVKALYDEKIHQLDTKLEALFSLLQNPKLKNNTIVVITSDHGEEFMEHGHFDHGSDLYATQTRIPLIIHVPGVAAKKITQMTQSIDIYPTVLALTGLRPNSRIEGLNLLDVVKGKKNAQANNFLLSEFMGMKGIQMGKWRYYTDSKNSTEELYDLSTDPTEQINVLNNESGVVAEIKRVSKL